MKKRWYLGRIKGRDKERVFLEDFEWDCGWYWSGGHIGNDAFGAHFDGCFLEVPDIRGLQAAAECFQYGGHCCSGHTPPEINPSMAAQLNAHIEKVIIPAIRVALDKVV